MTYFGRQKTKNQSVGVPAADDTRVITCRQDQALEYNPGKAELPLRESSFVQVGSGEHRVDVQMATLGDIGLNRIGINVEAIGTTVLNPGYIAFVLPVCWTGELLLNGAQANRSSIYLFDDLDGIVLRSKNRVTLGVSVPRAMFVETLAALAGVYPEDICLAERELCLGAAQGVEVRFRLTTILERLCNDHNALNQREIRDEVVGLLAQACVCAASEPRQKAGLAGHAGRIVRLAEERFMAAPGESISLADLCAAAGVSKSQLYRAFGNVCGLSPLAYFQKRRLMQVRSLLLREDYIRGGVKRAALSCGVTEFGRFAAQYKQMFGELPSATLHRPLPS